MVEISLTSGARFAADRDKSILEGASLANVSLAYSCRNGRCSTCKCKVISGDTEVLHAELGLTEEEKADGWILSCVRAARSDLVIEANDLGDVAVPPAKVVPCRISGLEKLASDVLRVQLRLPPTAEFDYLPGQYIDVIGQGGVRRSYSVANARRDDKSLELHIRAVDGGTMSDYWFTRAKENDLLRLHGPLGTFFLRSCRGKDLVFLVTGTGIAPVKAMLEWLPSLSETERPESITVLWGGRIEQDLYFDVEGLSPNVHYVPVLSRADDAWNGARGYVQDALLARGMDLSNVVVYACGSDAMIHSAHQALTRSGLSDKQFFSDAFVCSASN